MDAKSLAQYLPVTIAALAVLFVGFMNPAFLRKKDPSGVSTELKVDYRWLAASAFVAGGLTAFLQSQKGYEIF